MKIIVVLFLILVANYGGVSARTEDPTETKGLKQGTYVPAIFMKYAIDKMRNRSLSKMADFVIDVATIAGTGGAWAIAKGASKFVKLRKAWVLYNTISSGISLVINLAGLEENVKYKKYVKWFQFSQMLTGGGDMLYNGSKNFLKYLNKSGDIKSVAGVKEGAQNFAESWIDVKPELKPRVQTGQANAYEILETRNDALALEIIDAFALDKLPGVNGVNKFADFKKLFVGVDESVDKFFDFVTNLKQTLQGTKLYSQVLPFSKELFVYTSYTIGYLLKTGKDKLKKGFNHFEDYIKNNASAIIAKNATDVAYITKLKNAEFHNALLNLTKKFPEIDNAPKFFEKLNEIGVNLKGINKASENIEIQKQIIAFSNILDNIGGTPSAITIKLKTYKIEGNDLVNLATTFSKNQNILDAVKADANFLDYWQLLNKAGRSGLINDFDAIAALKKAMVNTNLTDLGINATLLAKVQSFAKGPSFVNILNDLEDFASLAKNKGITITNFDKLVVDLTKGGSFSDGAHFIVSYVKKNINDFANKKLKFEDVILNGDRRIDISDLTTDGSKILFEFKSVDKVPPTNFAAQFMNDLTEATSLNNIKWIFNKNKNPNDFIKNMEKAINELQLTQILADKYGAIDAVDLKAKIKNAFTNIFKLSN